MELNQYRVPCLSTQICFDFLMCVVIYIYNIYVHTGLDAEKRPLIKIENCLFEWNRWHSILPTFIPPPDLKEQGFEIGEYETHLIFS